MKSAMDVVRTYCDAWLAGDAMAGLELYHADLTLDWPGDHRYAGRHLGQQASLDAMLGVQALTNRQPLEIIDILEGQRSIGVIVAERWTRNRPDGSREDLDHQRVLEYTVEHGQLRTCRVYESEQRAVDEWLG